MKNFVTLVAVFALLHTVSHAQSSYIRPFIGLTLGFGAGLTDFDTGIRTEDNKEVRLSTGGGFAIGAMGHIPIAKLWALSGEVNYQFTSLQPKLSNADGGFYHYNFIPQVRRLIPVGRQENYISTGIGPLFSMSPKLEVNASKIPDGHNYAFTYNSAVGAAFNVDFIFWTPGKRVGALMGLRYTLLAHEANKIKWDGVEYGLNDEAHQILPDDIDQPDGSGIDLVISLLYRL
jgi:hypothetical protein